MKYPKKTFREQKKICKHKYISKYKKLTNSSSQKIKNIPYLQKLSIIDSFSVIRETIRFLHLNKNSNEYIFICNGDGKYSKTSYILSKIFTKCYIFVINPVIKSISSKKNIILISKKDYDVNYNSIIKNYINPDQKISIINFYIRSHGNINIVDKLEKKHIKNKIKNIIHVTLDCHCKDQKLYEKINRYKKKLKNIIHSPYIFKIYYSSI